ncbi:ferredoxin [Porcincola intestinalis]|uniref:ferredoxin n=1 Tax=Porcincola intestinalis TaxID=2606632 RepID=UPI0023F11131|nr:ferredoxin [Porcincola intestinalis]MDD7059869.1 ferredoxin [Porcincola intestinalis]MDY5284077.1 ferredoxin [Porcincola intestinalis]
MQDGTAADAGVSRRAAEEKRGDSIMKYAVDENCIGCGLCNATCPEVFSMTDEGIVYDCLMP